jgi:hypothetical protein
MFSRVPITLARRSRGGFKDIACQNKQETTARKENKHTFRVGGPMCEYSRKFSFFLKLFLLFSFHLMVLAGMETT